MKTVKSIQNAIDTVIEKKFRITKTLVKHNKTHTRIYLDSIHSSDFVALNNLVEVLDMANKDRNVFLMVDSTTVHEFDSDYRELLGYEGKHVRSLASIFLSYDKSL